MSKAPTYEELLTIVNMTEETQIITKVGSFKQNIKDDIVFWSQGLYSILGFDPDDPLPNYAAFSARIHAEDKENVDLQVERAFKSGASAATRYRYFMPNGSIKYIFAQAQIMFDKDGNPRDLVGTAQDVTQYVQIVQKLKTSKQKYRQLLNILQKGVWSIGGDVTVKPVQLKTLVEKTLMIVQDSAPANIHIYQENDFNLPLITGNPPQISQVILNLCINAIQAMPDGGTLSVKLDTIKQQFTEQDEQHTESFVCLTVQDTGYGMAPSTLARIYEPFFTTKEKGQQQRAGLGLTIVSNVIKQLNGHIEVESELGKGTSFHIYFPATEVETALLSNEAETFTEIEDAFYPNEVETSIEIGNGYVLFIRVSSNKRLP